MSSEPSVVSDEVHQTHPDRSHMTRFLKWAMPSDPQAVFVYPQSAHAAVRQGGSVLRFVPISIVILAITAGLITVLLMVPGLEYSVVSLLITGFDSFLPHWAAVTAAWVVGISVVMKLGSFVTHTPEQAKQNLEPATKNWFYNLWLRFALMEEMVFRAGSEKWTWMDRIRASFIFGAIHITNIWYSLAAGIALSLTGFAFMLVYLWAFKRSSGNQTMATAVSGTVHAVYNTIAITIVLALVVIDLFS